MLTFERIQTLVRKAFDPESISVTVGQINDAAKRYRIIIRDEISKMSHTFHVNVEHTEEEIKAFIEEAGEKLGLIKGPEKVGNEIVEDPNGTR